ncbi:MAG: ATP-binding protein [Caldilineaceae bacterium]
MNREFVGRNSELNLLDELWSREQATLLILYGRRRVGKTRLLTHWIQQSGRRALYWVAEPSSAFDQLRSFSQAIYNFAHPDAPAPPEFAYATWEQAWQQVASLAGQARLALFVDEFTYLLEVDPGIAGKLQNLWDHHLSRSNLALVLCGSHLGMMQRHLLSYQAPLYGRATAQMRLQPLPFGVTSAYFPNYDADERVAIYAMWGGIPAYWERLNAAQSISDNIRRELLTPNNLMQAEPRLLLQDFVNDPHNYVGILRDCQQRAPKRDSHLYGTGSRSRIAIHQHAARCRLCGPPRTGDAVHTFTPGALSHYRSLFALLLSLSGHPAGATSIGHSRSGTG